jgi:hypothetical protein
MLSYNIALGIFMMLKLEGKQIENHPIIERMAYLRTLLWLLRWKRRSGSRYDGDARVLCLSYRRHASTDQ